MALVRSHIPFATKLKNYPEQDGVLTYNAAVQSPIWKYFNPDEIEIVGGTTSAVDTGSYYTDFKPRRNRVFPDLTKKVYRASWTMQKATGSISLSETSGEVKIGFTKTFVINRAGDGAISVLSSNANVARVSLSGNVVTITGVSVGDATITISVAEGRNYLATSAAYSCRSRKTQITIPTVTDTLKIFTGNAQSPTITNAPSTSLVTLTGTTSATNYSATPYSFTYTIKNTNAYEWANGSTAPLTFTWSISKKSITKPTIDTAHGTTFDYDGEVKYLKWYYLTDKPVTVTNNGRTEVGEQTVTISLNDKNNMQWTEDGTTTDLTWTLTVNAVSPDGLIAYARDAVNTSTDSDFWSLGSFTAANTLTFDENDKATVEISCSTQYVSGYKAALCLGWNSDNVTYVSTTATSSSDKKSDAPSTFANFAKVKTFFKSGTIPFSFKVYIEHHGIQYEILFNVKST